MSAERSVEQILDRALAAGGQRTRSRAGEMCVRDERAVSRAALLPLVAGPGEPAVFLLIEDVQRLVAQLRELRAPSGAAANRAVLEHGTDDVDLLSAVHLIPDRLEDLSDRR